MFYFVLREPFLLMPRLRCRLLVVVLSRSSCIEMDLEADKGIPYLRNAAQLRSGVADGPVSQLQEVRQLGLVEFANTFVDVL